MICDDNLLFYRGSESIVEDRLAIVYKTPEFLETKAKFRESKGIKKKR